MESGSFIPDQGSHSSKRKEHEKTKARKSYVRGASDVQIEDVGSIRGGAARGKMQNQDQRSRSRVEKIPDAATTAIPSENITMSLDMSSGSSEELHITLTIPPAFNKYHVTIIHGNTTLNYTVNGETATSTPQHAMEEI